MYSVKGKYSTETIMTNEIDIDNDNYVDKNDTLNQHEVLHARINNSKG